MSRFSLFLALALLSVTAAGCYHARIETGLTPGSQVIEEPWAMSYVFGLVPPETLDASSECGNGVATVETQISFLNGLVAGLSLNIITPMTIRVTCAAGSASAATADTETTGTEVAIARDASDEEALSAIQLATELAVAQQEPVRLRFY